MCQILSLLLSRSADPLKTDYQGFTPHAILLSRTRENQTTRAAIKKIDNLARILTEAIQKKIELDAWVEEHKGALFELPNPAGFKNLL